jgi:hypothetical protein
MLNADQSWTGVKDDFDEKALVAIKDIDWKTIDCVAGFLPIPYVNKDIHVMWPGNVETYQMPWDFSPKSKQLLSAAKEGLLPNGTVYLAVHWRRGDQLVNNKRCAHKTTGGEDSSVNCKSAKEFLREVSRLQKKYNIPREYRIYVATNEEEDSVLSILEDHGMYTFRNIRGHDKFDKFDSYIIEVQIMCEAKYLFNFGKI